MLTNRDVNTCVQNERNKILGVWNISRIFYFSSWNMGPTLYMLHSYFSSVYIEMYYFPYGSVFYHPPCYPLSFLPSSFPLACAAVSIRQLPILFVVCVCVSPRCQRLLALRLSAQILWITDWLCISLLILMRSPIPSSRLAMETEAASQMAPYTCIEHYFYQFSDLVKSSALYREKGAIWVAQDTFSLSRSLFCLVEEN